MIFSKNDEMINNDSIFCFDAYHFVSYFCVVTFNNNDYGKRKSNLLGSI